MKKKLLITGAYGLVGSAICKIIDEHYSNIEVIKIKFDEHLYQNDRYDYIIHAAGYGQPQLFSKEKLSCISINSFTTAVLFKYLKPNGKFLFVSTSEVYSGSLLPHKETDIGTTTPQHHRACYIEGKRCGEAICMAYKEQGFDVKIARLALAYGPRTKKHDTRVLNQFIEQALTTNKIKLMDDGSAKRTYCYVEDAAEMMLDILFKGTDVVYNVGGFSEISILDLAHNIALLTGANVIPGDKKLEGSPDSVKLDMTKTLKEFPRDFISLTDGLFNTIEYQKKLYETQ